MVEESRDKVRVIVQARTDSSRLLAKALLPVGGIPAAILASLRATNQGHEVILATTDRPIDDHLSSLAIQAGIAVYRGSADDVRSRFLSCSEDMAAHDILVRLTADNVLPDGDIITTLLRHFETTNAPYLNLSMIWRDPPYGLACEAFRVNALRTMARNRFNNRVDREHVTTSLRRVDETLEPKRIFTDEESDTRVTIDTLDDYLRVAQAFYRIVEPVKASWRDGLDAIVRERGRSPPPRFYGPGLVLGTAQLGAPYGSVQKTVPPEPQEAAQIVRRAVSSGAIAIDTARAYPGAESIIGKAITSLGAPPVKVITKITPLDNFRLSTTELEVILATENSVLRSLHELGGNVRPFVLLHRASQLHQWNGAPYERIVELQSEGLIEGIGVSVSLPSELLEVLTREEVNVVQIPFNILDQRWLVHDIQAALNERSDIEVHLRSIYLQGILLRDASKWPRLKACHPSRIITIIDGLKKELERESIADLCVAWARGQQWAHGILIGMESLTQLEENLRLFDLPPLTKDELNYVNRSIPKVPDALLDPAQW